MTYYCGACGRGFADVWEFRDHRDNCLGSKVLLPFVFRVWSETDLVGHPIAGVLSAFPAAGHLLRCYAMAVSSDLNTLERARLHRELCDKLRVKYEDFRPFEADGIKSIPTYEEAEKILWLALEQLLLSFGPREE